MKDSPQEIGFVIGALVGFIWLLWDNVPTTRASGGANYVLMMLCGGVGWAVGWLVGLLF